MPRIVTLSFLSQLNPTSTKAVVTGPGGAAATSGTPGVKGNKVSVGVLPGQPGKYTVAYQVSSIDGHKVKGEIHFTVTAVAATASAPPSPSPAAPAAAATSPAAAPAGPVETVRAETAKASSSGPLPWLLGALVLLIAVGAGFFLIRRRATP